MLLYVQNSDNTHFLIYKKSFSYILYLILHAVLMKLTHQKSLNIEKYFENFNLSFAGHTTTTREKFPTFVVAVWPEEKD